MAEAPIKATVFAYQVGFGDCMLVRFTYRIAQPRHMLVDFGTTGLPKDAERTHMVTVARDIAAKVREGDRNRRLDVLVATHRHADHISGFSTEGDPSPGAVIRDLNPRVVVQPWTEKPEAPVDWQGPPGEVRAAFTTRVTSLQRMHEVAASLVDALEADRIALSPALSAELAFIGRDNLKNLSAVENLQAMGDEHRYAFHGSDLDLDKVLPGIEVHVLGPPTLLQTQSIRQQRSSDPDEFWQLAPKRLADALAVGDPDQPLFPDADYRRRSKTLIEHRWLAPRIEQANAELLVGLVRALDAQMNNTSLILLLKAGSKTMLLPGDAQIENWAYALQSPMAQLLADVDLYKVGHHGSRNATPKSMWRRFAKRGKEGAPGRLTSVLSTKAGKHGSVERKTEVPRLSLVRELEAESDLLTTEALAKDELFQKVELDLT